jgi:hypothetical protein
MIMIIWFLTLINIPYSTINYEASGQRIRFTLPFDGGEMNCSMAVFGTRNTHNRLLIDKPNDSVGKIIDFRWIDFLNSYYY